MKKITASIILLLMLYNMAGCYACYFITKNFLKKSSTESNHNQYECTFAAVRAIAKEVTRSIDLRIIPETKFVYKGTTYDVMRKSEDNGHTIFYSVNHRQEENLKNYLKANIEQNNPKGKKGNNLNKGKIKKCITTNHFALTEKNESQPNLYILNYHLTTAYLEKDLPPPKYS